MIGTNGFLINANNGFLINLLQLVLEHSSIDNPLTFDISLIQLSFHTSVFT